MPKSITKAQFPNINGSNIIYRLPFSFSLYKKKHRYLQRYRIEESLLDSNLKHLCIFSSFFVWQLIFTFQTLLFTFRKLTITFQNHSAPISKRRTISAEPCSEVSLFPFCKGCPIHPTSPLLSMCERHPIHPMPPL